MDNWMKTIQLLQEIRNESLLLYFYCKCLHKFCSGTIRALKDLKERLQGEASTLLASEISTNNLVVEENRMNEDDSCSNDNNNLNPVSDHEGGINHFVKASSKSGYASVPCYPAGGHCKDDLRNNTAKSDDVFIRHASDYDSVGPSLIHHPAEDTRTCKNNPVNNTAKSDNVLFRHNSDENLNVRIPITNYVGGIGSIFPSIKPTTSRGNSSLFRSAENTAFNNSSNGNTAKSDDVFIRHKSDIDNFDPVLTTNHVGRISSINSLIEAASTHGNARHPAKDTTCKDKPVNGTKKSGFVFFGRNSDENVNHIPMKNHVGGIGFIFPSIKSTTSRGNSSLFHSAEDTAFNNSSNGNTAKSDDVFIRHKFYDNFDPTLAVNNHVGGIGSINSLIEAASTHTNARNPAEDTTCKDKPVNNSAKSDNAFIQFIKSEDGSSFERSTAEPSRKCQIQNGKRKNETAFNDSDMLIKRQKETIQYDTPKSKTSSKSNSPRPTTMVQPSYNTTSLSLRSSANRNHPTRDGVQNQSINKQRKDSEA